VVRLGVGDDVFVLVPGGRQIDWPLLRAHFGVSRLSRDASL
jgi:Cys-tRNA(Pro)/Cys-tRNA(Cys) deacylase